MVDHPEVSLAKNHDSGVIDTVANFGKGLWHGAIENPINGCIQVVNHAASTDLPELDLVDSKRLSPAGQVGASVGTAIDVIALAYATKSIGGPGKTSALLRAGAAGAIYGGLLQPTDPESRTFVADRLGNAAIGGITAMAAMGTSFALDRTGAFAVPAARSLHGSIIYGAATGAGSGLGFAQSTAMIKQGRLLPTVEDLIETEKTFIAWGAIGGAMGYAFERATAPAPRQFELDGNASMKVWYDRRGNPYRVRAWLEEDPGSSFNRTTLSDTALTTKGTWGNVRNIGLERYQTHANARVDADGTLHLFERGPKVMIKPDGYYEIRTQRSPDYEYKIPEATRIQTPEGRMHVDARGNIRSMQQLEPRQFNDWKFKDFHSGTHVHYDKGGSITGFNAHGRNLSPSIYMEQNPSGNTTYRFSASGPETAYSQLQWNGSISSVETPGSVMKHLEFKPANGGQPFSFRINSDTKALLEQLSRTSTGGSPVPTGQ